MLKHTFSNRNYFVPLSNPKRILDIGTGTGQWAIEMGDEFPDVKIQGTDLSPIQPSPVPEDVHFFIDDVPVKMIGPYLQHLSTTYIQEYY